MGPCRVLERYGTNGRALMLYGRFQEDVCNDLHSASKYYAEATKLVRACCAMLALAAVTVRSSLPRPA